MISTAVPSFLLSDDFLCLDFMNVMAYKKASGRLESRLPSQESELICQISDFLVLALQAVSSFQP